jgi:hypothetical protein
MSRDLIPSHTLLLIREMVVEYPSGRIIPVLHPRRNIHIRPTDKTRFFFIFIVAPSILKIHLLSPTNICTDYIIYYSKSV